jgi:hypothetical protein
MERKRPYEYGDRCRTSNRGGSLCLPVLGWASSWCQRCSGQSSREDIVICRADGREESLDWRVSLEFPVVPEEERVKWWWARYAGYGMLFIPVWDEMEGLREGWRLSIDRSNIHTGKYTSQGLESYSLLVDDGDRDDAGVVRVGDGWRTCMLLRPTSDDRDEVRGLAAFYCSRVDVKGDGVTLGPRTCCVPGKEIAGGGRGDRPWDVVVEGARAGVSFELAGVSGCGILTVTLRGEMGGEIGGKGIRYAYDGTGEWQEFECDRPCLNTAAFSLPWKNNRSVRIQAM